MFNIVDSKQKTDKQTHGQCNCDDVLKVLSTCWPSGLSTVPYVADIC